MSDMASAYLDALRAIGANLVIVSHVTALYFGNTQLHAFGSLGVVVFFLLSGFLIMQSMLNWLNKPEPRLAGFLADRVARIMTPYVPALLFVALANLVFIRSEYGLAGQSTGALAFVGNLVLLQDHAAFQALEVAGFDFPWRIRQYNSAEPFWTVAIEMWIYVSVALFFFCLLQREKINRGVGIALAALALPVFVWNAAAGGGKSLSLIWLLGALAGFLFHLWRAKGYANIRSVAAAISLFGLVALMGLVRKIGFQPFDFQTATLLAMIMFGVLGLLMCMQRVPVLVRRLMGFMASYSYSLYLIHNTVLVIVLESTGTPRDWSDVAVGVAAAHLCAYLLYMAFERHYRTVGRWLRPTFERLFRARGGPGGATLHADLLRNPTPVNRQER